VSDVGGAVGLWIGLSILSIFEVIQLVVELVQYCVHICRCRDEKRKRTSEKQRKLNGQVKNNEKPKSLQNGRAHDTHFGN